MNLKKLIVLASLVTGGIGSAAADDELYVQLIFDASGSMAGAIGGEPKINAARRAIGYLIDSLPEDDSRINVGFRVFGHEGDNTDRGRSASCRSSDLKVPMESVNQWKLHAEAAAYQPTGWTPITLALTQAGGDFAVRSGRRNVVVLVTDGEETCFGDPCAAARMLGDSDAAVVAHVIGFGLDPKVAETLKCVAANTGGAYVDAGDGDALAGLMLGLIGEEVRQAGAAFEPAAPESVVVPAVTIDQGGVFVADLVKVTAEGVNVADAVSVTEKGVDVAGVVSVTGEGVDVAGVKINTTGRPPSEQAASAGAIEARLIGTWKSVAPAAGFELVFRADGTGQRSSSMLGAGTLERGRWRVASAAGTRATVHLSDDGFDTFEIWNLAFSSSDRFTTNDPFLGIALEFVKTGAPAGTGAGDVAAAAERKAAEGERIGAAGERTGAAGEDLGAELGALGESLGAMGRQFDPQHGGGGGVYGDILSISESERGKVIHCEPNGDCGCEDGARCIFHCDGGNCDMECGADSECVFNCDGGNCDTACGAGSRCITQCAWNCDMDCDAGARCRLND